MDSVLNVFSVLMLACNSDQCMPQGGVRCPCESCMDCIAAPFHVLTGSLISSDVCSLPLHTMHLCAVVQCIHLPLGGAVDLSALHGVVASPGYCTLCSSVLGAARSSSAVSFPSWFPSLQFYSFLCGFLRYSFLRYSFLCGATVSFVET